LVPAPPLPLEADSFVVGRVAAALSPPWEEPELGFLTSAGPLPALVLLTEPAEDGAEDGVDPRAGAVAAGAVGDGAGVAVAAAAGLGAGVTGVPVAGALDGPPLAVAGVVDAGAAGPLETAVAATVAAASGAHAASPLPRPELHDEPSAAATPVKAPPRAIANVSATANSRPMRRRTEHSPNAPRRCTGSPWSRLELRRSVGSAALTNRDSTPPGGVTTEPRLEPPVNRSTVH